jgi:hypothetical protein
MRFMVMVIRVFIPLTLRRRNGRPRIQPPGNMEPAERRSQDPHVLRAHCLRLELAT